MKCCPVSSRKLSTRLDEIFPHLYVVNAMDGGQRSKNQEQMEAAYYGIRREMPLSSDSI